MCFVYIRVYQTALFNVDEKIALLIMCFHLLRHSEIALAEGRVLQVLPVIVAVTRWCFNRSVRFNYQQLIVAGIKLKPVNGAAWYNQVIAVGKGDVTIHGSERA